MSSYVKNIVVTLLLMGHIVSNGQSIMSSLPIRLNIDANTRISDASYDGRNLVAVGSLRSKGNLDVQIVKFSVNGEILQQKTIESKTSFDRATSIISDENLYWVLINKLENKVSKIEIHKYDINLNQIDIIKFEKPNFVNAISLSQNSRKQLVMLVDFQKEAGINYPVVLTIDADSKKYEAFHFDKNNQSNYPRKDNLQFGLAGAGEFPDTSRFFNKSSVGIDIISDKVFVVGTEDTGNLGDLWAGCSSSDNELIWDQIFEKENDPGVDYLCNAEVASNGGVALFGVHYDKSDDFNYNFNYLLLDRFGNTTVEKSFDLGFDEHLVRGYKYGSNYLLTGYVAEEPEKSGWVGENIKNKNLWYLLINEDGTKIDDSYLTKPFFQTLISSTQISRNELLSIYEQTESDNDGFYITTIKVK